MFELPSEAELEAMHRATAKVLYEAWRHSNGRSVEVTRFIITPRDGLMAIVRDMHTGHETNTAEVHIPTA